MTRKRKMFIAVLAAVAVLGFYRFRSSSQISIPDGIWVQANQVHESSMPIEINAIGILVARSVEITPEIAGHVEKVLFHDGQFVKAGASLVQLDDTVYKAKHASAQADLAYKEGNFKRMRLLGQKGILSKDAMDQAQAVLAQKRAEAEESGAMLSKTNLIAPIDGMVGKGKISHGDYLNPGQSIVTLTDTHHLRVEFNVPEKYVAFLKLGQAVTVTSPSYPGKTFSGKVSFISPTVTSDNRSISMYADIPNEADLLKAGMMVTVMQSLGTEEHALMVPVRSLVPVLDGSQIYTVVDGKAKAVNVKTGKRIQNEVQIVEGLSPGDNVITDGQFKVKEGMPVKVKT